MCRSEAVVTDGSLESPSEARKADAPDSIAPLRPARRRGHVHRGLLGDALVEALDDLAEVLPPLLLGLELALARAHLDHLGLLADVLGHEIGLGEADHDLL